MARYVTREWFDDDSDFEVEPQRSCVVLEQQPEPMDTGVLDQFGRKLYRVEDRQPPGFKMKG